MRANLKGLASATKVLADGTKRKYFYAWRGGPLLRGPDGGPSRAPTIRICMLRSPMRIAPGNVPLRAIWPR